MKKARKDEEDVHSEKAPAHSRYTRVVKKHGADRESADPVQ